MYIRNLLKRRDGANGKAVIFGEIWRNSEAHDFTCSLTDGRPTYFLRLVIVVTKKNSIKRAVICDNRIDDGAVIIIIKSRKVPHFPIRLVYLISIRQLPRNTMIIEMPLQAGTSFKSWLLK